MISNIKHEEESITFVEAKVLPEKKEKVSIKKIPFELCDKQAVLSAKKLAAFLKGVSEDGYILYGHQNDLHRKAGPHKRPFSCSDTYDVTGEYAAVCGLDALCLVGTENGHWYWTRKERISSCVKLTLKSIRNGSLVSLSAHMPNFQLVQEWKDGITALPPLHHHSKKITEKKFNGGYSEFPVELKDGSTNFFGYTPNDLRGSVVRDIMPGKKLNGLYTEYLDLICDYCAELNKKNVAIIWRPFHENSGGWFWWGSKSCTPEEFIALWRYTYKYFTEEKNIHNLIWAYSPGSEYHSVEEYESRYPGDDYVDLLGFDMYQQYPDQGDAFWPLFEEQCRIVSETAEKHGKLFANTETGIMNPDNKALLNNGNHDMNWYEKVASICLKYKSCYYLLWANFWAGGAYYTPYIKSFKKFAGRIKMLKGHEMLDSFIRFYNNPKVLFSKEIKK